MSTMIKDSKESLKKRIDIAAGRIPADILIKNVQVVNVFSGRITAPTSIAISDQKIAAIGDDYEGKVVIDGRGQYASPGFVDSHIHIESSYLSPEEFGRLMVPTGTTTA